MSSPKRESGQYFAAIEVDFALCEEVSVVAGHLHCVGSIGAVMGLGMSVASKDLIDSVTGYNSAKIAMTVALYLGIGFFQLFINTVKMRISLRIRLKITNMREFQEKEETVASSRMSFNQETLQNLQLIKAFGVVGRFVEDYEKVQNDYMDLSLKRNKFQAKLTVMTGIIGQLIGYACYGFAVYRLWQGTISYGMMTMFVSMSASLRSSFNSVLALFPTLIQATISAKRILEVISLPREDMVGNEDVEEIKECARHQGVYIHMKNVGFWYEEGKYVYKDVFLETGPGEIIGLIGPSGQGKTTTLRLLLGLYHAREGIITINKPGGAEVDIGAATRCLFSYIPQNNIIFSGTIADNMRMLRPEATDEEIESALRTACIWDFVESLEEGINSNVNEGGKRFSEGQKQRLSIARALLMDSPVLLLDEATSALDISTEVQVLHNIMKREPNRTIIVAAHRPSVFSMCSRVYKIQKGEVHETDEEGIRKFLEMNSE